MKCRVFENREVTEKECFASQKGLPKKYCEGCDWFGKITKPSSASPPKSFRYIETKAKYTVYLPKKIKRKVIAEAQIAGVQPAIYISRLVIEKINSQKT